ncbi:hypothetical protein M8R20_31305 [Pseudomonas sp. R2.Fl]|nr:hypothetical protein [Pseudomonas sp. R2.Fl]
MKLILKNPVFSMTLIGIVLRLVIVRLGVDYDGGPLFTAIFFVVEFLCVLVNVAREILFMVLGEAAPGFFWLANLIGLGLASVVDLAIRKVRARYGRA